MIECIEKAKKIRCLICDVDGVLTNGQTLIDHQGNSLKSFHLHDGMGLVFLMAVGIDVAVITTSNQPAIDHRMQQLGIRHYFKGQRNKQGAYVELKARLNLNDDEFAYIGDDLPDIALIRTVGLGVAVANAVSQVKECADWQTQASGGNGGVREVCDFILTAQNKSESALSAYLAL